MQLLFALSASLWAFVVARCMAFGPNMTSMRWNPNMHSQTWYRLTPIKCGMIPHKWISKMSIVIALANLPTLLVKNTIIHSLVTLKLVSEHLIVPVFAAQKHNGIGLWAVVNAASVVPLFLFIPVEAQVGQIVCFLIQLWIVYIQCYLTCVQNIVRDIPHPQLRQARVV